MTKTLKISPSQIDKAMTCPRSWWLRYVMSLPEPPSLNTLLGDIGHGVAERFLTSKDLYPEGWERQTNRFTGKDTGLAIDATQQAIVKALIDKGIAEGVLTRLPDGKVEVPVSYDVGEIEGVKVKFSGFVDYASAKVSHVQDHKFCGDFKYYGKAKLERAVAMNSYAKALYEKGFLTEPSVWLRYNLFRKHADAPAVKTVEVERTREQIDLYWQSQVLPVVRDMVLYYKNAVDAHDVPMAEDKMSACNSYGGCPFLTICTGRESCREYKARLDGDSVVAKESKQKETLAKLTGEPQQKEKSMSLVADLARRKAMAEAAAAGSSIKVEPKETFAPAPVTPPPVTPEPAVTVPETPAAPLAQTVPWYSASCPVCNNPKSPVKVMGMSGAVPCQVCKVLSVREGKPGPDEFKITVNNDGTVTVVPKWNEATADVGVLPLPQAPIEVVEPVVAKAPEMSVKVETPPAPALPKVVKTPAPVAPVAPPPPTEDITRKEFAEQFYMPERKGFTIAYHRVQNRKRLSYKFGEANHTVYLKDFMMAGAKEILNIARESGIPAEGYYAIPTFTRRDMINANAPRWAELLGNSTVEAVNVPKGSDDQVLIQALEAYASVVIGEPV